MTLKVSNSMTSALNKLREFGAEQLKEPGSVVEINIDNDQLVKLTEGYTTTLSTGTERGVTVEDLEATHNFRRDLHTATRALNTEVGIPYLEKNGEQDSQKLSINLPEVAGHGLSITSAVYRPGANEETNQNYSAVTHKWAASEDDKAVDEHLAKLSSKLKAAASAKK